MKSRSRMHRQSDVPTKRWQRVQLAGIRAGMVLLGATLRITDKMEAGSPAPSPHSAGTDPGMKELGLVIRTCLFLLSVELSEKEY